MMLLLLITKVSVPLGKTSFKVNLLLLFKLICSIFLISIGLIYRIVRTCQIQRVTAAAAVQTVELFQCVISITADNTCYIKSVVAAASNKFMP